MDTKLPDIDPQSAWAPFEPSAQRPWSNRLAAHLLRRSGFGGSIEEITLAQSEGLCQTLDKLFETSEDQAIEKEMAKVGRLVTGGADSNALAAWWLLRMVKTPTPFLEKMALFWHGHFATGADKVMDSRAMFRQNQLIRKHALGRFGPFVEEISSNVAMLIYLDSEENRKTRPNENFARELMELFCLGPGNYTEKDIKEVARCFTGCEIRKKQFRFNEHQHDENQKSFLGATGKFKFTDAIKIVLSQPAAPVFIAKKLVRYFVFDDQPISDKFVEPIARKLLDTDFDILEATKMILGSNVFYSDIAVGKKIKSPVELAVGFLRFLDASTNINQLGQRLKSLGQLPLYPPNVKGWPGGKTWINAATILARANLIDEILRSEKTKLQAGSLDNWMSSNPQCQGGSIQWVEEFLLATKLSPEMRMELENALAENGDLKKMLAWLSALPEFQLC